VCFYSVSKMGVHGMSFQTRGLNPIGHYQYISFMVVALLCLLRTLRTLLIPNSKMNCCALAFLWLSLPCWFSSSFVKRSRRFLISDLRVSLSGHSSYNPSRPIRHGAETQVFECPIGGTSSSFYPCCPLHQRRRLRESNQHRLSYSIPLSLCHISNRVNY